MGPEFEKRLAAAVDMTRRTGAQSVELRYSDDQLPVVWMAIGEWLWLGERPVAEGTPGAKTRHEVAAALNPLTATMRLLDQIVDGGTCQHCGKVTAVSDNWAGGVILEEHICWYIYDPEVNTFRRQCEGEDEAETAPGSGP
jgi:hypothetical protein